MPSFASTRESRLRARKMEGIEGLEGESDNREAVARDDMVLIIALELLTSKNLISSVQYHSSQYHHRSHPSTSLAPIIINRYQHSTLVKRDSIDIKYRDTQPPSLLSLRHTHTHTYQDVADRRSLPRSQRERHHHPPRPLYTVITIPLSPLHNRCRLKPLPSHPLRRRAMGSSSLHRGVVTPRGDFYAVSPLHAPQDFTRHV